MNNNPVFLKAIPRSGGTLLITMLDAHPEIAMSYEIYEENLFSEKENPLSIDDVLAWLEQAEANVSDDVGWIKKLPDNNLRVFLLRAMRGGLGVGEIVDELRCFHAGNGSFDTSSKRLDFIEALMKRKIRKYGKKVWGGKTQADLYELHKRHPDACFFIMIRDIRDVFASMRNTGNFKYSAEEAASLWKRRILDFREFATRQKAKTMEICYEKMVREPAAVLKVACQLIGVEYSHEMLEYHEKDMTLFRNPHGHLSYKQLKKGLNTASLGRWEKDLNSKDIKILQTIASDLI